MGSISLIITGTPTLIGWGLLADPLVADLPWVDHRHVVPDAQEGARLLAATNQALCLALFEPAGDALAQLLAQSPQGAPGEWLDRWPAAAKALLVLLQANRPRCLVVDALEARLRPQRVRERLAAMANQPSPGEGPALPATLDVDPLILAAARALSGERDAICLLQAELAASCDWLEPGTDLALPARSLSGTLLARLTTLRQPPPASPTPVVPEPPVWLVDELHRTQEALEQSELARRQLQVEQARLAARPAPKPVPALVSDPGDDRAFAHLRQLTITGARDERPYRELSLTATDVRLGKRLVAQAPLRLVEHHGHPGLVLLAPRGAAASPLVDQWVPDGAEGDRGFMLLIPQDARIASRMVGLGSRDWLTVLAISQRIEQTLAVAPAAQRRAWLPLAARLREALETSPEVLRHAGSRAAPVRGDTAGSVDIEVDEISWGRRHLPMLRLRWLRAGPGSGLAMRRDGDVIEPLISWPEDANDEPLEWLPLTGSDEAAPAALAGLGSVDRRFLRDLAAALPHIVSAETLAAAGAEGAFAAWTIVTQEAGRRLASAGPAQPGIVRRLARRLLRRPGTGR